jgi:tetratricopeptide (TPR) repeat protein
VPSVTSIPSYFLLRKAWMGVDFNQLSHGSPADRATEPRRIFAALPSKDPKYSYPRDVQSEVWDQWHARRDEPDLIIKMNTGGGKTVVGLLQLKSSLNEGLGPAVYVVPDRYLADQVRKEATSLGVATTDDPRSPDFLGGKAILVANIYKLVNGLSVFGTAASHRRIAIGTLLIDDAHACISTVEEQFTLNIDSGHKTYGALLDLFAADLSHQSKPAYLDIKHGDPAAVLPIPFWAWADRQDHILKILHPHREDEGFLFVWPLISESLPICRVAVSSNRIQIAPPCPPIDRIPSITSAKRRIYMTATLPDDSVLVTHFGANPSSVARPITPKTAGDLGDRMILTPLDTHPGVDETEVQSVLVRLAASFNVVVIVPSKRRAQVWKRVATAIYDKDNIEAGVTKLKAGHVGLVVLINKYDGIDLPGDACRVLAIDGLPEAYGELDRLDALALSNTGAFVTRQVQRIEQGMGRGVRSNEDWCAVLLLGSRLTERLYTAGAYMKFSPATRAQLALSRSVSDLLRNKPLSELDAVILQCLHRDAAWVSASRSVLDGIVYDGERPVPEVAVAQRAALDLATVGQYRKAADALEPVLSKTADTKQRGWLKAQAAAYRHLHDPVAAQDLLTSALADNRAITKPRHGVGYTRLSAHSDQAKRCSEFLVSRYSGARQLLIAVAAILDDLTPHPDSTEEFEQAWYELGSHLGFASQRPERDQGDGPDVLWMLGDRRALVTECKSGVTTDSISRHDAAQLSHSVDWFAEQYDSSYRSTPLMLHRTNVLHSKASARYGMRVITFDKLQKLRESVDNFIQAVSTDDYWKDHMAVAERLASFHLTGSQFLNAWALPTKK